MTDTKKLATNPERQEGEKELVSRRDAIKAIAQASLVALVGGLFTMGDNTAEAGIENIQAQVADYQGQVAKRESNGVVADQIGLEIDKLMAAYQKERNPEEKKAIAKKMKAKIEILKTVCQDGVCNLDTIYGMEKQINRLLS